MCVKRHIRPRMRESHFFRLRSAQRLRNPLESASTNPELWIEKLQTYKIIMNVCGAGASLCFYVHACGRTPRHRRRTNTYTRLASSKPKFFCYNHVIVSNHESFEVESFFLRISGVFGRQTYTLCRGLHSRICSSGLKETLRTRKKERGEGGGGRNRV